MEFSTFLKKHRPYWLELEQVLTLFHKKTSQVRAEDIDRLTFLYKQTSSDLAYVITYHPHDETATFLNGLVSQAHNVLYKEQNNSSHQLRYFFNVFFPSLIHERRFFIGFAVLLFLIGALSGFIAVWNDPLNLYSILPPDMTNGIDPNRVGQSHDMSKPIVSTEIMTNNIKVAIMAFLGGITFGIMTSYYLVFNGLLLGTLAAVFWKAEKSVLFWAYILPHGVIELSVIFIAGGAGLYMGYRMFVPGRYPWKLQLQRTAKESAQLLLGTLPFFILAGFIEGYITPSELSIQTKYMFAIVALLLFVSYLVYGILKHHNASFDRSSK